MRIFLYKIKSNFVHDSNIPSVGTWKSEAVCEMRGEGWGAEGVSGTALRKRSHVASGLRTA